jgi:hypothetical protein
MKSMTPPRRRLSLLGGLPVLATVALLLIGMQSRADAATEHHFCWGAVLTEKEQFCSDSVERNIHAIYASSTGSTGRVCIINVEGAFACEKKGGEGVYVSGLEGVRAKAGLWQGNVPVPPMTVYGVVWDGSSTPVWPHDNLGGAIVEDPGLSSWESGRLDVFTRATNNTLYHKAYSGGEWTGWEELGGGLTSGPDAVSWGPSRIDVVARGGDGAAWHKAWDGTKWNGWESLGGGIVGSPAIASWESGRLDVFARGTNNALYHKAYTASGGWTGWEEQAATLTSGPDAVSWGPSRIDVVARGSGGAVLHKAWNGISWSGWESLGGETVGDPTVCSWESGRLDVFARGTDNGLYHQWYTPGGGWSGWVDLGGPELSSSPDCASWGKEWVDVTARALDGTVTHWGYQY